MKNGHGSVGPRLFGDANTVGVQRGLAEFRAGRPVIIHAGDEAMVALPVDGADADRIAAFKSLLHPRRPRLAITARRARALGLDATEPVLLELDPADDELSIFALAADADVERKIAISPAGPAAIAAIELAKLVQRLPALLVADAAAVPAMTFDPPLVSVEAKAVGQFPPQEHRFAYDCGRRAGSAAERHHHARRGVPRCDRR